MSGRIYLLFAIVLGGSVFLGASSGPKSDAAPGGPRPAGLIHALKSLPAKANTEFTINDCAECHEDAVGTFQNTTHARAWHADSLQCSNCHRGDFAAHIESGGDPGTMEPIEKMSAQETADMCLKCHEQPGEQAHMRQSEHMQAGVSCLQCHDVHPTDQAKAERASKGLSPMMKASQSELCTGCHTKIDAELSMPTHHRIKEGVMQCTDCHNPHGTAGEHQLRDGTKETCVNCHEDKRGPFIYEHDAAAVDGCTACHQPHGSTSPHMLKARDERTLCISCHSKDMGAGVPHSRLGLQATGDCTRCHSEIHGSNASPYLTQ